MSHGKQVLIAIDQLLNTCFLGWADETLSSRAFRWYQDSVRSWPMRLIDALFWFDHNHCRESYESERRRAQMPPELRNDDWSKEASA